MLAQTNGVVLDYTKEDAESIICQAMLDETIRLKKAPVWERNGIRAFLIEAFQLVSANAPGTQRPEAFQEIRKKDFVKEVEAT